MDFHLEDGTKIDQEVLRKKSISKLSKADLNSCFDFVAWWAATNSRDADLQGMLGLGRLLGVEMQKRQHAESMKDAADGGKISTRIAVAGLVSAPVIEWLLNHCAK